MEKRSIRVKKLFIDMIRYWYLILVFMVAGGILGWLSASSYNLDVDNQIREAANEEERLKAEEEALAAAEAAAAEEAAKPILVTNTYTKDQCETKLTDEEKQEVMDIYAWYVDKQKRIDYLASSPYMNLDPYNIDCIYLRFRVDHTDQSATSTSFNAYVHGLKLYVIYNSLVEDLAKQENTKLTPTELEELISLNDGGKDAYDDFILISVYQCEGTKDLTEAIKGLFLDFGAKLSETYPAYTLVYDGMSRAVYYSSGISSAIDSQRNSITSDQSKIDAGIKKFTEMQHAYYKMIVGGTEEETFTTEVLKETTKTTTTTKKTTTKTTEVEIPDKKGIPTSIALGCVGGVVVLFILIFLFNLLSPRLLFAGDFQGLYGVENLGMLEKTTRTGIGRKLLQAEYPEAFGKENLSFLMLALQRVAKRDDAKRILLLSSLGLEDVEEIGSLQKQAKDVGIEIVRMEHFPENADAAKKALEENVVLLVEEFHKTKLQDMDRITDFCRKNDMKLIGAVGIVR